MKIEMTEEIDRMLSGSSLPLYERAVVFATVAHQRMTRKGSRVPYLTHPVEAAAIVAELTDDEELVAAAVLHDVVEDTDITLPTIEQYFG
ncbi:MAG: HD domain-containing protein, partial [Lachnospiraceae bacterium]|nr:HD domain-containing protein [Lachnospiraceae bacterium]